MREHADELDRLWARVEQQEREIMQVKQRNHQLEEIVKAADLVHIRLRAALREAIGEIEEHERSGSQRFSSGAKLAQWKAMVET